jgi:hypothetical protein
MSKCYFTSTECDEIKSLENKVEFESINFNVGLLHRYQGNIAKRYHTPALQHLIKLLKLLHPKITSTNIKLLKSDAGCEEQPTHYDDDSMINVIQECFEDISFSLIISLENSIDNPTSILIGVDRKICVLLQGSIILFRGNFFHAGAAYNKKNLRLFIGIGTNKYTNTGDVVRPLLPPSNLNTFP